MSGTEMKGAAKTAQWDETGLGRWMYEDKKVMIGLAINSFDDTSKGLNKENFAYEIIFFKKDGKYIKEDWEKADTFERFYSIKKLRDYFQKIGIEIPGNCEQKFQEYVERQIDYSLWDDAEHKFGRSPRIFGANDNVEDIHHEAAYRPGVSRVTMGGLESVKEFNKNYCVGLPVVAEIEVIKGSEEDVEDDVKKFNKEVNIP